MEYEDILSKFKVYKSSGNQAKCICPSHDDKEASLSVCYNPSAKRTLIYCQAGCETRDILQKVNLNVEDLYDRELEKDRNSILKREIEIDAEDLSLNKELFNLLKEQLKQQNLIIHELNERLKQEQALNEKLQSRNQLEEHFIDLDAKLTNIRAQMGDKEVAPKFFKRIFKIENNESNYKYKK